MKKKLLSAIASIAFAFMANAQDEGFKVGLHVGATGGDAAKVSSFNFSVNLATMLSDDDTISYGYELGYTRFIGKEYNVVTLTSDGPVTTEINGEDFGFLHAAFALKCSFTESSFIAADLGYAINLGDTHRDGGYYYQPKAGFQTEYFDVFASYKAIRGISGNFNASSFGVGTAYKF